MRFSTVAATALAAAAPLASAAGSLGFALGTKQDDGTCKTQADYEADFDAISAASGSNIVRGYAASDCEFARYILPAAKNKGFKVFLGIWPDVQESFDEDLKAITTYAPKYKDQVYAVTVGSETLYRGNFTGAELKSKIQTVQKAVQGWDVKVGTADSWNKYADGTADAIIGTADILLINAFAFWQGDSIKNATHVYLDDMFQAITHIEKISGDNALPEIWNGETGWPTAVGTDYEEAQGGLENAKDFYHNGFCSLLDWGFNAFYFEAFDELWKPASIGDNGKEADETTWGAFYSNRKPKFSLKCGST